MKYARGMLLLPALLLLAPQDLDRARVLATAERYATLEWTATEANAFHGEDDAGTPVDTPDQELNERGWTVGAVNVGVPYKWGGWDTPERFLARVAAGDWAGHWPVSPSDPRTSPRATGVDCSGFVSRCWELPYKHSTRSLGPLCWEVAWGALEPGDLLNSFDGHAILFAGWVDEARTTVRGYEAGFPGVVESEHTVESLRSRGMVPQRYKPLDARWPAVEAAPAREVEFGELRGAEDGALGALFHGAPGEWARYRWVGPLGELELTRTLADADARVVVGAVRSDEGRYERLDELPQEAGALALFHLRPLTQAPDDVTVESLRVQDGWVRLNGLRVRAQQVWVTFAGTFTMRGVAYPYRIEAQVLRSDALPLEGVLEARFFREVEIGGAVQRSEEELRLVGLGAR